jgi:hypothetical protein
MDYVFFKFASALAMSCVSVAIRFSNPANRDMLLHYHATLDDLRHEVALAKGVK